MAGKWKHLSEGELDATGSGQTLDLEILDVNTEPQATSLTFVLHNIGTAEAEVRANATTAGEGAIKIPAGEGVELNQIHRPMAADEWIVDAPLGAHIVYRVTQEIPR